MNYLRKKSSIEAAVQPCVLTGARRVPRRIGPGCPPLPQMLYGFANCLLWGGSKRPVVKQSDDPKPSCGRLFNGGRLEYVLRSPAGWITLGPVDPSGSSRPLVCI